MFPTGELGAHKLQSYEFSALVSHDLIDSCKVFAAGPMGKADDGLVEVEDWGEVEKVEEEEEGGCPGRKSSSICFLSTRSQAARFPERP